jgi:hypothetical protein
MGRSWRLRLGALALLPGLCIAALNDTGQSLCYGNDGRMESCDAPTVSLPGQDGVYGRDAQRNQGMLRRAGRGEAGFDFVAIDASGAALAADEAGRPAGPHRCVRDAVTGLLWWLAAPDSLDLDEAEALNTLQAITATAPCGVSDWRLPSLPDLLSVANLGNAMEGIDPVFFTDARQGWFRSGDRLPGSPALVRVFSYQGSSRDQNAKSHALPASRRLPLRLVSGDNPAPALRSQAGGTVVDLENGLEWDACIYGRHGQRCRLGQSRHLDWPSALAAVTRANESAYKGYRDWRLPNVKELYSIVDQNRLNPAIDDALFPHTEPDWYWSSSSRASYLGGAHSVDFNVGQVRYDNKPESHFFRLVRDCCVGRTSPRPRAPLLK